MRPLNKGEGKEMEKLTNDQKVELLGYARAMDNLPPQSFLTAPLSLASLAPYSPMPMVTKSGRETAAAP